MKNVVVRSISGLVYIIVIVTCILCGWKAFTGLMAIFAILAMLEYTEMAAPAKDNVSAMRYAALGLDVFGVLALTSLPALHNYGATLTGLICFIAYLLLRFIATLYDRRDHAMRFTAKSVLGVMYIGLALCALNFIYTTTAIAGSHMFVLLIFITIWINDTGAFCFGSTLGKHRLFERHSPKKSWEGFWGGMACCVGFGILCFYQFNSIGMTLVEWIATGVIISAFATWGDLFESMIKRTVGVKDSGALIPGHGGILDRIDSLLFVAPAMLLFLLLID